MSRRLFTLLVVLVVAVALITVSATGSSATGYKGDVDYWGALTVSIDHNQVTALQGRSGGIPCAGPSQINPVLFSLSAPVPVINGKFHAQGTALDDYRHPIQWSLDASISVTRTILGTVSLSGPPPIGSGTCSRTFRVAAIIPPTSALPPQQTTFVDATPASSGRTAPDVNFDFRHGVITHFSARATTMCGQSVMGARLYSTAYHLDPIQVNGGRFRIVADVLDDYSVVTHVVVAGRIVGKTATGTIDSSRSEDLNGTIVPCSEHYRFRALASRPTARSGGAFYDLQPYRYGHSGAFQYYFAVEPRACINHVSEVRFSVVGGPSRTAPCNARRKLGPLQSKRNYHIRVLALHTHRGKVVARSQLADTFAYLPGDDANWVPAPWVP
jgi:hypothetical protein